MESNRSEMFRGFSAVIVLSLLEEHDDYVYQICKTIKERSNGCFSLSHPSLLLLMDNLEQRGFVSHHNEKNANGVKRKRYSLTLEGKQWLAQERPHALEA